MKIKSKFFAVVLASLLTTGCQDEIHDSEKSGKTDTSVLESYVKVAINMPSTVGTRAAGTYDNGIAGEYKVNNAIIAFFDGTDEQNAKFLGAYSMEALKMNQTTNTSGDQITTTSSACIMEAPMGTASALAIVNPDETLIKLDVTTHELTIGDDEPLVKGSAQFSAFKYKLEEAITAFTGTGNDDFTMTNAPLSDKNGQATDLKDAKATTLVGVTVYDSRTQADKAPADQIYVERVAAKVSMNVNKDLLDESATEGTTVIKVRDNSLYKGDKVQLHGWKLNVTNKSTKLVRDVTGFAFWVGYDVPERFVENDPVKTGVAKYRINWAVDYNYTGSDPATVYKGDYNIWSATNEPVWNTDWTGTEAEYCLENTFDTKFMCHGHTTQALIKTTYLHGSTTTTPTDFVVVEGWNNGIMSIEAFFEKLKQEVSALEDADITLVVDAKGGYYNVEGGKTLENLITATTGENEVNLDKITEIESIGVVKYYKNGATYYHTALIRHFNQEETSWGSNEEYTDSKHLGRYGVVRNTWYQLTINSISGPGEPEIPTPDPSTPDDQEEAYIKVEVNILDWAVRQNNIDL